MNEINTYLTTLVKQLSITKEDKEKIDRSYRYLESKIQEQFPDRIKDIQIFGSYDRGTALPQKIDPNSDVDVLVTFKTNEFQPATLLKHLQEFATKIYSRSDITSDHPAITIELDHTRFELVPAYWERNIILADELKIPAPRNRDLKWIPTYPSKLKSELEEKNMEENQMITPLIKVIKYFNVLSNYPYDSYRIERFAIKRSYPEKQLKDYLFEFIIDLKPGNETERQKMFIKKLKTMQKNLLILEKEMPHHIHQEFQIYLPIIQ